MPAVLAKLRFQKTNDPSPRSSEWGEFVLLQNGTVRLRAGEGLRRRLTQTADRVDRAALLYGATAFMGIAALGTTLVLKRKTVWGYLLLLFAALTALGGSHVRGIAQRAPKLFDTWIDKDRVDVKMHSDGSVIITLSDKPWNGTVLRLEAGEFNRHHAAAFIVGLKK